MSTWEKILYALLAVAIIWYLLRFIRSNPGSFSKENFTKGARTLGLLAVALIVFVGLCVMLLRG